ncbi:plexin-A2-like [Physella acuta]|uniref:plexin-A2-like n=1 Tax=Physella acuta TaxID=109671 RepID=UPI0027DE5519|nr:plexin-A2-like [Physella acuta]XP_059158037.1 plexin-A2-like [Physella acuta]
MAAPSKTEICIWPPLHVRAVHVLGVLLLLTLTQPSTAGNVPERDVSLYQTVEFPNPQPGSNFTRMAVDPTSYDVYIGASDYIYCLSGNLTRKLVVKTGPLNDDTCQQSGASNCAGEKVSNVNTVLLIDESANELIVCGTGRHGSCEKRNLNNITILTNANASDIVSANPRSSVVAFLAPGPPETRTAPQKTAMYVAVSWSVESDGVPAVATRKLTDFGLVFHSKTDFYNSEFHFEDMSKRQFPVNYIYGFSSENFSYILMVQKNGVEASRDRHSVAIRLCHRDQKYYSYTEVAFKCMHEGTHYNLLQAAYRGTAGRKLAQSLGGDTTQEVLYGIFANKTTNKVALCVYKMQHIREFFHKNIKKCFEGNGHSGGAHLGPQSQCEKATFDIPIDFCPEKYEDEKINLTAASSFYGINPFISGTIPMTNEATMVISDVNDLVTSLFVDTIDDYTIAYVGDSRGLVLKISIDNKTYGHAYEKVRVARNLPILRDMSVDDRDKEKHLFVMTPYKVLKMALHQCSQYKTCTQCLEARDPYCGWCSTESECTTKSNCTNLENSGKWDSYDTLKCPKLHKILPDQIHLDRERLVSLEIHDPPSHSNLKYTCVFSSLTGTPTVTVQTDASASGINFQCLTPDPNKLPKIPEVKESMAMSLSLKMNGQDIVTANVTFFNCSTHQSCISCSSSKFKCWWCIKDQVCTDNHEQNCPGQVDIIGSKANLANTTSLSSTKIGDKECPRFLNYGGGAHILVPAGTYKPVTVRGESLRQFQLDNLQCHFLNDYEGIEHTVPATYVKSRDGDNVYNITCDALQFSYIRPMQEQKVKFNIIWGVNGRKLDNQQSLAVLVYKCSVMASTCGECLTIDTKFGCGWCNNSNCVAQDFCKNVKDYIQHGTVCTDPKITAFHPTAGPINGGTLIEIDGQNLGIGSQGVRVRVGPVPCTIEHFKAPNSIHCRTASSNVVMNAPLEVFIGSGSELSAKSVSTFSYVVPVLSKIVPTLGPAAGGTTLTLVGEHLDSGSNVTVELGQSICSNPVSLSSTALTCTTPSAVLPAGGNKSVQVHLIIDNFNKKSGTKFEYVQNPNITWFSRTEIIRSGGLQINVSGDNLNSIQSPAVILWYNNTPYYGNCTNILKTNLTCITPTISGLSQTTENSVDVHIGFKMDNVKYLERLPDVLKVFPDPKIETFTDGEKVHKPSLEIFMIMGESLSALKPYDIIVSIGKENCTGIAISNQMITCKPPLTQPASRSGSEYPEVSVQIGVNLTYDLGILKYDKQEGLSEEAVIAIGCSVGVVIVLFLLICIYCLIRFRRNDDMMKKMRKEMDQLESRVANECKEAFAELQTDMTELTSDLSGGSSIPFWDYRTYCMRVLFPPDCNDHPVIKELELDFRHREDTERGLKAFFNLIRNKTFLLIFVRTLEGNPDFTMKDRVNVASLISVCLQTQMEYATEILKTLLAELIEKTVENPKVHPKLLLRRNESVAEKMLTNWYTFLLYKFLKECAGEPLFMLYGAIKQQVSKGPVDAVTSEARYSLSEDKLIRQHINYKPMVLHVMDLDSDRCSQPSHPVKVLDCDTISQVKEKILDSLYKSAPFSIRPLKDELDLVLFDHPSEWIVDKSHIQMKMFPNRDTKHLVLNDEDHTTKTEGDCKRLNTLSHYKVPDGAYVALHPKQTSIYNMSIMSEKSKYSENSYYNRSPSLNRSLNPQVTDSDCKVYHLVRHQDVESSNKEGERGSKLVSEIYLPRLLVTKGTLQTFVDDLFERIFSTAHRGTALPLAIKYMFDFLDDQALHHSMNDEVVHTWKSNSLPLRFWVNVIKNPNFAFDIYKSNIVDACLTVIGQTFMDCCSTVEHKLTKDSPSGKLLYAKDIPKYKTWVSRYYQDIKIMPAISDQDMTAMLAEESRTHQNVFNTNAALLELYKYVKKYYDDIMNALEDDEFAKKSKLTCKLEEASNAMDGNNV